MNVKQIIRHTRTTFAVVAIASLSIIASWPLLNAPIARVDSFVRQMTNESKWATWRGLDPMSPSYDSQLIELAQELNNVQKTDALSNLKRMVLATLTDHLLADDQLVLAFYWIEHWLAFDQRDITAHMLKAYLLMFPETTRAEGSEIFASLGRRFPENMNIASVHVEALLAIDKTDRALQVALPFIGTESVHYITVGEPYLGIWVIEGDAENGKTFMSLVKPIWENDRWQLHARVPQSMKRLRVTNSEPVAVTIKNPLCAVAGIQTKAQFSGTSHDNDLYNKDSGESISFDCILPSSVSSGTRIDSSTVPVRFEATVERNIPSTFTQLASHPRLHSNRVLLQDKLAKDELESKTDQAPND